MVFGVGYNSGGIYETTNNRKHSKIFSLWQLMMQRCYSEKYHIRRPTYIECYVCEEWKDYQKFAEWCSVNYVEGWHLDKDIILKGNKMYSPNTCAFVPKEINLLFLRRQARRGKYPIGVCWDKQMLKFRSIYKIKGKHKTIGLFNTPELAFNAYKLAKEKLIKEVADEYKDRIINEIYYSMHSYKVEITD